MARQSQCRLKEPAIWAVGVGQGEAVVALLWLPLVATVATCSGMPRYVLGRARLALHGHDAKAAIFAMFLCDFT